MKIPVLTVDFEHGTCGGLLSDKLVYHGYVELDEFDPEKVFNLCNYDEWSRDVKPKENHTDIDYIGHGLVVVDERENKWHPVYHLALSAGWLVGDYNKIQNYIHYHMHPCCLWTRDIKF